MPVPDNVWTTPGHYNIVGLLPEDNTYAKGSMYILEPASLSVVPRVTSMPRFCLCRAVGIAPVADMVASGISTAPQTGTALALCAA